MGATGTGWHRGRAGTIAPKIGNGQARWPFGAVHVTRRHDRLKILPGFRDATTEGAAIAVIGLRK
jgi:hypothetical protein